MPAAEGSDGVSDTNSDATPGIDSSAMPGIDGFYAVRLRRND